MCRICVTFQFDFNLRVSINSRSESSAFVYRRLNDVETLGALYVAPEFSQLLLRESWSGISFDQFPIVLICSPWFLEYRTTMKFTGENLECWLPEDVYGIGLPILAPEITWHQRLLQHMFASWGQLHNEHDVGRMSRQLKLALKTGSMQNAEKEGRSWWWQRAVWTKPMIVNMQFSIVFPNEERDRSVSLCFHFSRRPSGRQEPWEDASFVPGRLSILLLFFQLQAVQEDVFMAAQHWRFPPFYNPSERLSWHFSTDHSVDKWRFP